MSMSKGFSIIEVIIAIAIISVIGIFTSTLLTRTYRSSSDTELVSELKQNGNVALNNMDEVIRMANAVVCSGPEGNSVRKWIVIRTFEGKYWLFRFVDPVTLSGTPTQNGYIARQENLNRNQLDNFCITNSPDFAPDIIISNFVKSDINTGVSISNGEFKRLPGIGGKDTVIIKFDIGPAGKPSGSQGTITMQATIQVR